MLAYARTGDQTRLAGAVNELGEKSTPQGQEKLKSRRVFEANLINSTKSSFYTSPLEGNLPKTLPNITLEKTVVPYGIKDSLSGVANPQYYIWRTAGDDKVRATYY
jgi:hypothetical protein